MGNGRLDKDTDGKPAAVTEGCVLGSYADVHLATASPLAGEALERIGDLLPWNFAKANAGPKRTQSGQRAAA